MLPTNAQDLVQHERYFAFGELWRPGGEQEECDLGRPDNARREWLFTSKEWDVDTGLYYFGARYFDPHADVWQSTDPMLAKYMATGGSRAPQNLGLYTYSWNNPVNLRDPDGNEVLLTGNNPRKQAAQKANLERYVGPYGTVTQRVNGRGDTVYGVKQTPAQAKALSKSDPVNGRAARDVVAILSDKSNVYAVHDVTPGRGITTAEINADAAAARGLTQWGGANTVYMNEGGGLGGAYAGNGYPQSIVAFTTVDYTQTRTTLQAAGLPQTTDPVTAAAFAFGHEVLGHGLGRQQIPVRVSSPLPSIAPTLVPGGDEAGARAYERRFITPALGVPTLNR